MLIQNKQKQKLTQPMDTRNMRVLCLTVLAICLCRLPSSAQNSEQVWVASEITKKMKESFDLGATVSWRQSIPHGEWRRAVIQLSGAYTHKAFRFLSSISAF